MDSMKSPFAVIIGDVNIDIITPPFDPKWLAEGETSIVLDEFTPSLGGNGINVAATLASLEANHLFFGGLGDCGNSIWIEKKCKKLGVNTHFGKLDGKSAGITFAMTYHDGRRQFVATLGTNKIITYENLNLQALKEITPGCHVHRSGFWYTPGLKGKPTIDLFRDIISRGGDTSIDVGWDPEGFTPKNRDILYKTLEYTKFFFGNQKEIKAITQKEDINDAYDEMLNISTTIEEPVLVVHGGEKGCFVITRNEKIHIDSYKLKKIINPTGSGDVFNGGFIYGLLQGWDFRKSAEFANKTACVHLQDLTKIYPNKQDVNSFRIIE